MWTMWTTWTQNPNRPSLENPQSSWGSTFSDENHRIILQLQASPQWKTIGSWSPAGWEKVFASWLSTHGSIQMFQRENMENHKNYLKVDALDPTELIFPTRILIQLNSFFQQECWSNWTYVWCSRRRPWHNPAPIFMSPKIIRFGKPSGKLRWLKTR